MISIQFQEKRAVEQPGADTGTQYVPILEQQIVGTFVLSDSYPVPLGFYLNKTFT